MRRTRSAAVGIAVAALVPLGVAPAAASTPAPPASETIELLDVSRPVAGPEGDPAPGDVYEFDNLLRHPDRLDAVTRQVLGRFPSSCTVVEGTQAECAGTLVLRDGTIEVTGTPDLAVTPIDMTITGGTGRYSGVAGSAQLTPTETAGVSRLVVTLERPSRA
jgi:hypothetical protein